ncbi:hypothetical protein KCU99_g385, partial [Aureobasidium melanogenum]
LLHSALKFLCTAFRISRGITGTTGAERFSFCSLDLIEVNFCNKTNARSARQETSEQRLQDLSVATEYPQQIEVRLKFSSLHCGNLMTKFLARFLCNEWLYALTATPCSVRYCSLVATFFAVVVSPSWRAFHLNLVGISDGALQIGLLAVWLNLREPICCALEEVGMFTNAVRCPGPLVFNALLPVASLFSVAFSLSRGVVPRTSPRSEAGSDSDWFNVRTILVNRVATGAFLCKYTSQLSGNGFVIVHAVRKVKNLGSCVKYTCADLASFCREDKTPARRTLQYIEKNTLECCKYCTSQLLGCGSSCIGWVVKSSNSFCVRFARHSPSSNILYQSLEKANASTKQIVLSDWELRGTDDGSETADVVVNGEQSTACQKRPDSFRVNGHQRLHESNNVNQKIQ